MPLKLSEFLLWKPFPKFEVNWNESIKLDPELVKNPSKYPLVASALRVGIEVEVENVVIVDRVNRFEYFWNLTEDGSLRNHGREFVSSPIYGEYILAAINHLDKAIHSQPKKEYGAMKFTDLCGTHVHLNVREFTIEQVANLLALGVVYEGSLFRISGDRMGNIFCVPLSKSEHNLRELFLSVLNKSEVEQTQELNLMVYNAHKYLALNYKPIHKMGTVEFRHAAGTGNPADLLNWINVILRLGNYALSTSFSNLTKRVFELNTNSEYDQFSKEVFKEHFDLVANSTLWNEMSSGVSRMKNLCIPVHDIYVDDLPAIVKKKQREEQEYVLKFDVGVNNVPIQAQQAGMFIIDDPPAPPPPHGDGPKGLKEIPERVKRQVRDDQFWLFNGQIPPKPFKEEF